MLDWYVTFVNLSLFTMRQHYWHGVHRLRYVFHMGLVLANKQAYTTKTDQHTQAFFTLSDFTNPNIYIITGQ